ncbi:MAG: TetR/AcrR family transcriptional regulator [bacterium]
MAAHLPKEERKRQLLDAALKRFGEKGYHATQVSDIIDEAKVARGTFYLYFKSKREIFDQVMTELFDLVHSQIRSLPRNAVDQIPSQIMGNIRRITRLLREKPVLAQLLMNEAVGLDTEQDARLRQFYDQILDYIRRGLKQGQEMGFVREGNVRVLAICLLGCVKEVFYQSFLGTEKAAEDEIVKEIYQIVVGAVAHPFLRPELEKQGSLLQVSSAL